ncbi:hypothetical protein QZM66_23030 [Burkholderia contaminans]|uniref:hypothetical protein n=1 Tax=Burkholderia contaminans TaxID=488447 RepID=UPI00264D1AA9|nr:hypothetical protein [Burkholderia contaminans]MDN7790442.1 hypothetical protein [Burkholderia contaminans]
MALMNFNLNVEARKVAELLDRSRALRRLAWGVVVVLPVTAVVWKAAEIVRALALFFGH